MCNVKGLFGASLLLSAHFCLCYFPRTLQLLIHSHSTLIILNLSRSRSVEVFLKTTTTTVHDLPSTKQHADHLQERVEIKTQLKGG